MTMRMAVSAVALAAGLAHATEPGVIERGKAVFDAQRCRACHSIGGEGNRRFPLDGVGARLGAKEIRTWIVAPQEMDPAVRKPGYGTLPAADLDALVGYLGSLR